MVHVTHTHMYTYIYMQTWLGLRFAPVAGPSSSGDQVLGARSRPQLKAATYPLPRPSHWVFWVCVPLLIFCFDVLSNSVNITIIVLLSISSLIC